MSNNPDTAPPGNALRRDIILLIAGGIIGVIFGELAGSVRGSISEIYDERKCNSTSKLSEARSLNAQAREKLVVGDRTSADRLFAEANLRFKELHECGIAAGSAHLGLNTCHGLGLQWQRKEGEGMNLLRVAAKRDELYRDWVNDRAVCLGVKPASQP